MYFFGLNLGPPAPGHLETWHLHLNKLGTRLLGNATYQMSSKPSGSEVEDFLIFFYVFLWLEPMTPGQRPSWTLGPSIRTNLVEVH